MSKVIKRKIKTQIKNGWTGWSNISDFDERGNLIHTKADNETETWMRYDDNNNKIYKRTLKVYPSGKEEIKEEFWEYNIRCDVVNYRNSDGFKRTTKYNENKDVIYYEDSYGYWEASEYDEDGNIISYKNSDGFEEQYEYEYYE